MKTTSGKMIGLFYGEMKLKEEILRARLNAKNLPLDGDIEEILNGKNLERKIDLSSFLFLKIKLMNDISAERTDVIM